ncbi:endonuclease domain-containing protein [Ulvibacterium marinum]|uniref:Endonuclease domain-containing protein n=1 Tax=Ulvibacterium marinum TaxID=2419782 RepID=A0A3B0CBM0_9FLAO|nr:endonuclease domain-containing protein [Ulvibacterium marinum]RKN83283.1 endonuclease domain-containing protein [Ulvibacterium marinum]
MKKHDKPRLRNRRKELRQNLTPAEAFLWKYLQHKKLAGRKFRRQHSIGNYIVDFYCASERLIVELDGEVHNNSVAAEKDERRTKYLENLNYKVIRFENKMVFDHLTSVLQEIEDNFKK